MLVAINDNLNLGAAFWFADNSDSNRDRVVGIGDAYAWHLAQKETQASA